MTGNADGGRRPGACLPKYHLAIPAPAGTTVLNLMSMCGLQIGDALIIDAGTMYQEFIQVAGFGSLILSVPTRYAHVAGAPIAMAMTYQPGTPAQAQFVRNEAARHLPAKRNIPSQGGISEDDADSLHGFSDNQAWSEPEREHQKSRHRRKAREALRLIARALPAPPIVSQTIRQPGKFQCTPLPQRGAVEAFEELLVSEYRSFTSLGESAEAYVRIVFDTAKACTALEASPVWEQEFENLSCDQTAMVIADEKWKNSMQKLLKDQQAARWRLRSKARRTPLLHSELSPSQLQIRRRQCLVRSHETASSMHSRTTEACYYPSLPKHVGQDNASG